MLIRRPFAILAALPLFAGAARAQIVEVELRDTRSVRALKKYFTEHDSKLFLLGEPVGDVEGEAGGLATPEEDEDGKEGPFALFVSDPGEPEDVPYKVTDGEQVVRTTQRIAGIPREDIVAIHMLAPDLTLALVAADVHERLERLAVLERRKKAQERGSSAWFAANALQLENQRRLQIFLERHGFGPAARKLDDEIQRLTKAAAGDPHAARGPEALASMRQTDPPATLVKLAEEISKGEDRFCLHVSTHVRIVHDEDVAETRAAGLLRFAEEIIEGFRREFVDPFACPDLIPERPFSEFFFGPAEDVREERYLVDYYRQDWGTEEEKRIRLAGRGFYPVRSTPPEYLTYWRSPGDDLTGLVAHRLGEQLCSIHFDAHLRDGTNPGFDPGWLEEAMAVYVSLEYLGASTTSCTTLAGTKGKAAEVRRRHSQERFADYYHFLALEHGRPLDQLALKDTGELGRADTAKAWCLLRFLTQQEGERGQDVLHSACKHSREKPSFLQKWREDLRFFYAVKEDDDPILALERLALPQARK